MEESKTNVHPEDSKWFALGAPYRNETKVYDDMCRFGVRCWIPMVKTQAKNVSKKNTVAKPAIANLLFAYTTEEYLLKIKPLIPRLQFKTVREDGKNKKITVPNDQMDNFIRFVEKLSSVPQLIDPELLNLQAGTPVKVTGGAFEGVEGIFIKLKGHRRKVLCVSLGALGSVIEEITPEYIQVL